MNSPIPRSNQPRWHEGSYMRSIRDSDSTSRQWIRAKSNGYNTDNSNRATFSQNQRLNKLRRRIIGGGASAATGMIFLGEWNPGTSYAVQNMVIFTPDGMAAGSYIALQTNSGSSPDTGSPNWVALPNASPGMFM